jgi:hypothetical protein
LRSAQSGDNSSLPKPLLTGKFIRLWGGRRLIVDTGAGAKETFELTGDASEDARKDVGKATAKGSKIAVYYAEDAGKKVAHFFEAM